jgi:anti-sigma factor RsiW
MVNCKQAMGQLADFLDRSLGPEHRDEVVEHLDRCPACVAFVKSYQVTTTLCRKVLDRPAPQGMCERVLELVERHAKRTDGE